MALIGEKKNYKYLTRLSLSEANLQIHKKNHPVNIFFKQT